MNRKIVINVVAGAALLIVVAFAFYAPERPAIAQDTIQSAAGMGDLHTYEASQFTPNVGAAVPDSVYVGMGDLKAAETLLLIPNTGALNSSPSVGIGDLRLVEALQAFTGSSLEAPARVGFGDLHVAEGTFGSSE